MTRFEELINETKEIINDLLGNQDDLPWYVSDRQLRSIIIELDKMNEVRDQNVFYPFYPSGIADSWDNNDQLANKLFDILKSIKNCYPLTSSISSYVKLKFQCFFL